MTLPDFSKLSLETSVAAAQRPPRSEDWLTPEGIAVRTAYTAADRAGLDFVDGFHGMSL